MINDNIQQIFKKRRFKRIRTSIFAIFIVLIAIGLYSQPLINSELRKNRITEIFNSLNIDTQKYTLTHESIFGDKRPYESDPSRSYSSERGYMRGANVDVTIEEIKQAVDKTDFKFYEEPYPDSKDFMYIYKSPRNEYLRISVASKPRQDEFYNRFQMGLSIGDINIDPNTGPSNVTIKVNLNDNNE